MADNLSGKSKTQISSNTAKKIVLKAQLLDGSAGLQNGKKGVFETINKLGYIQIDTISVIERSHHHTLWTHRDDYNRQMLHDLQAEDRLIFEYWGHAMSYLPMSDYRYYLPKMRNFEKPASQWAKYHFDQCNHLLQPVLDRIRSEGALSSKDFKTDRDKKGGTWWDWKPAKIALEFLFWKGDLMITERQNFHKVYDLTERILPENIDTTFPDEDEVARFLVRRAVSAMGIAGRREIQKFLQPDSARDSDWQAVKKETIKKIIDNLLEEKEIISVAIENQDDIYFVFPKTLETIDSSTQKQERVFLLSPFDNLIIQRERIKQLFGLDYSLECYVPEKKRKYGYFVLPILWGNNFVGRLDPKADRKKKTLIINNLLFEPHFNSYEAFLPLFAEALVKLMHFNKCGAIILEKTSPAKIKTLLESQLKIELR